MQLDTWVEQIHDWYQKRKHDQDETLRSLILSVPESVWGPNITDLQSKAIACWLDGCLRVFHGVRYQDSDLAYQYLQLAYSKLQAVVCDSRSEMALKDWCMKRMQHLTVLALEFCNQQDTSQWNTESHQLIESHVHFMAAQSWNEARNDDQEISQRH